MRKNRTHTPSTGSTQGAGLSEFETLVGKMQASLRARGTHLVAVTDSVVAPWTPAQRRRKHLLMALATVFLLAGTGVGMWGVGHPGVFGSPWTFLGWGGGLTVPFGVAGWAFVEGVCMDCDHEPRTLWVPEQVGEAYLDLRRAPQVLREWEADEETVGSVEALVPHAEELLRVIADLHAGGLGAGQDAQDATGQLVDYAARAGALTVLARKRYQAVQEASLTTAMLLARAPGTGDLSAAADRLTEETRWAHDVLRPVLDDGVGVLT